MCGRFTLSTPADVIAEVMQLAELITWEPRYNIAPTQPALAVRANDVGQRRAGCCIGGSSRRGRRTPRSAIG